MMLMTIDGRQVDAHDSCALFQALYAVKLRVLTGEQAEEIEVRSPVTSQRTHFKSTDLKALDAELERLQRACDAERGTRRRYAISGRF